MVNALGNYNEIFYAQEALIYLKKRLGLTQRCHLGYQQEYATKNQGDTISIRGPSNLTVASAPAAAQSLTAKNVTLTLDTWDEVRYGLTDKDMVLSPERFAADHVRPAAYQLANKVDQALATAGKNGCPWQYGAAGATIALADVLGAHQLLFDNDVPMDEEDLFAMIGGKEQNDLLALSTFATFNGAGNSGEQSQLHGTLGQRFGMQFFASQNRPVHTPPAGAFASVGTITPSGAQLAGITTMVMTAGTSFTNIPVPGDSFVIAGNTQRYAVVSAVNATPNLTVVFTPALVANAADADVITFDAEVTQVKNSLFFHRNFMAVGFGKLPDYDGMNVGAQVSSVVDEQTGLAVRFKVYGDHANSALGFCLDILYGVKVLNPNLAVRLQVA